jgi:endonuclease/exonuclease/phosphatase (EEP) superfamily protein YafD
VHQSGGHRLSKLRSVVATIFTIAALLLASAPWTGAWIEAADQLTPAWPLVPILAITVLVLARARSVTTIGALVASALWTLVFLAQPVPAAAPQAGVQLRVVTHNVWTDNVDPKATADVLVGSGADILLLQETNGRFASALPMLARAFPYSSPCPRRCPLIILSRYPIEPVKRGSPDRLWRQIAPGMMADVRIRLPGRAGVVSVATVHLARGQASAADLRQRVAMFQAMQRADGNALILAGDFNLVPWSARMRSLDQALAPVMRATSTYSWPAHVNGLRFPLPLVPIDHVYVGSGWALSAVHRLERTGSDHYPIAVDLIWQGQNTMITTAH